MHVRSYVTSLSILIVYHLMKSGQPISAISTQRVYLTNIQLLFFCPNLIIHVCTVNDISVISHNVLITTVMHVRSYATSLSILIVYHLMKTKVNCLPTLASANTPKITLSAVSV